jgi:hypothetical protein
MQLFSIALPEFSDNPKGVFNFMNIAMRNRPLPQDFPAYLQEFFICVFNQGRELGMTPHAAFDHAAEKLSERLLDSFLLHMGRNNVAIPTSIPDGLRTIIDQVEAVLQGYLPCTAAHSFPQIEGDVSCESSVREHGEVHQSSRTYTTIVPSQGFFARLFGFTKEVIQSCRWGGSVEIPDKYAYPGWLALSSVNKSGPVIPTALMLEHKTLLASQRDTIAPIKTDSLCLACLLQVPTEILQCSHKLCVPCCLELQQAGNTGDIECPFCNSPVKWSHVDIPDGAGFRILTIDGGGMRGVVSAVLLKQIEEQLGIPISELFDLIVGASFGGLIGIAFGGARHTGQEVVKIFEELANDAFERSEYFGSELLGQLFRSKYLSETLRNTLAKFANDTPLFGITPFPRLAVVACDVAEGAAKSVLFTSYNSNKKSDIRTATILETAETSCAGIYFEVKLIPHPSWTIF